MSEHDEQVKLFEILSRYEEKYPILKWVFAIPNGGKRHPATAVKMKAEGVKSGVWDVFVPRFRDSSYVDDHSCGLFIEMKFGKNGLTDNQKIFRESLEYDFGFAFSVCYTAEEAIRAIGEYLGINELMAIE